MSPTFLFDIDLYSAFYLLISVRSNAKRNLFFPTFFYVWCLPCECYLYKYVSLLE